MRRAVVAVVLVLTGCGGDPPNEGARTGAPVVVHGTIEEITQGTACNDEEGRRVVWYDATDKIVAWAIASRKIKQDFEGEEGVCRIADAYEIEVPRRVFYTVEVVGIPGRAGPLSFARLRESDFTLDLSISDE